MEQKTLVYSTGTGLAEISGSDVLMTDMFTCMWECGSLFRPSNSLLNRSPPCSDTVWCVKVGQTWCEKPAACKPH